MLALCILLFQTGCTTSKLISMKEASSLKSKKFLVLHTPIKTYHLYNYRFTNNTLEGSLATFQKNYTARINVYTDVIINMKSSQDLNQFITIKEQNILSINYSKPKAEKMAIITIASVICFYLLVSLLYDGQIPLAASND